MLKRPQSESYVDWRSVRWWLERVSSSSSSTLKHWKFVLSKLVFPTPPSVLLVFGDGLGILKMAEKKQRGIDSLQ